jgi:hypothetical protein
MQRPNASKRLERIKGFAARVFGTIFALQKQSLIASGTLFTPFKIQVFDLPKLRSLLFQLIGC